MLEDREINLGDQKEMDNLQSETDSLAHERVKSVQANTVTLTQCGVEEIHADSVDAQECGIRHVQAQSLQLMDGGILFADANTLDVKDAGVGFVRAETANISAPALVVMSQAAQVNDTKVGLLAAREVHSETIHTAVLLAGKVNGNVETAVDRRSMALFGVAFGVTLGLVINLYRLIDSKR